MQRNDGFLLATVMAVLLVIFLLTLSLSSLATTRLRVAENRRDRVVAEQAAEAGLALAIARLQAADGLPDELSGSCGDGLRCGYTAVLKAENETGVLYEVRSKGYGDRSAERELAALVLKGHGKPVVHPIFGRGLISKETVDVNGTMTIAGIIHGDHGFRTNGLIDFVGGAATASCPSEAIPASECVCSMHPRGEYCDRGRPTHVVPPADLGDPSDHIAALWEKYKEPRPEEGFDQVVYGDLRINSEEELRRLGSRVRVVGGDVVVGTNLSAEGIEFVLDADRRFTVNGSADLRDVKVWAGEVWINSDADLDNVGFVAEGRVVFNGRIEPAKNVVIVADDLVTNGYADFYDSKLLLEESYTANGNMRYHGASTLVSKGDLTFNGYTVVDSEVLEDGMPGLAVIAQGDIRFNGMGDPSVMVMWAGGEVTINDGASRLYGGVLARGRILKNGNTAVYAQTLQNDDLPTVDTFDGVKVLSRTVVFGD